MSFSRDMGKIGFYTLSDLRCRNVSSSSRMMRCEMILTDRCNFKCPYCRGLREDDRGDMPMDRASFVLRQWAQDGLFAVRFSGGEPTCHPGLVDLVKLSKDLGVEKVAVSTNGSACPMRYLALVKAGVNDFSVSLDACCSETCDRMCGVRGKFERVTSSIRLLSSMAYVTAGVVLTDGNLAEAEGTVRLADSLGVADIRVIPAAQFSSWLEFSGMVADLLPKYPILKYRLGEAGNGRSVRGLSDGDCQRCYLPLDDSAVAGDSHYPCVIYMREGGKAVGRIGPGMREDRRAWSEMHNPLLDPICRSNCLDVCREHNLRCASYGR